jgi:hypothetical protein
MQSKPENNSKRLDMQYRTMKIVWAGIVISIGWFFAVSLFTGKPDSEDSQSRIITFALTAIAILLVLVSFAIKQKFYAQAEQKQEPRFVQTGMIVALAMCEGAAMLGLIDSLTTGNRYYPVTFVIALLGMLLHFPRRNQLAAASYRLPGNQTRGT